MCGHGRTCDECGRGPCGPTYKPEKRDHIPDELMCSRCLGSGNIFVGWQGSVNSSYETCNWCNGTGEKR